MGAITVWPRSGRLSWIRDILLGLVDGRFAAPGEGGPREML
jgi:hypothetical protein